MEKQKQIDINEKSNFLKNSFIIGDSLSVGMKNSHGKIEGNVKVGAKTSEMLAEVEKNISKIKQKEVLFFLGGTNDVASGISENTTIENIRKIAKIAEENGIKFVPGTIPFMEKFKKDKNVQEKIEKINIFIKTNFPNFIDYNSLTKGLKQADGVHFDGNGYKKMANLQEQKFLEISGNKKEKKFENKDEFEKYFSEKIEKQKWFVELSPEKQAEMKQLYKQKFEIEKKLISYNSKKEISNIENTETFGQMNYDEKVDMIEREVDLLGRELYQVELAIAREELDKDAEVKAGVFKADMENPDFRRISKNIEKKGLNEITSGEIYSLKMMGYDLAKLFLKGNKNEIISRDNMKVGDKFTVNFGKNKDINKNIGIAELLPIDKFETVRINGELGTRSDSPRPGYYDSKGRYLSVYDNYKVELVSEKKYTKEEEEKYKTAFHNRYVEIRTPELIALIADYNGNSRKLENLTKEEFEIVIEYSKKYFAKEFENVKVDYKTQSLSSKNGKNLNEVFVNSRTKELGRNYLKYESQIDRVISKYPQIGKENLIRLINHENGGWNPYIKAKGSSAYGLGQMINSTWEKFGRGLNRNNPEHQLEATCKYLDYLINNKKCTIQEALAYYNTGEGIKKISNSTLNSYYAKNPAIVRKIPSGTPRSREAYFTGAVAYYNDLTYAQAKQLIS